MAARTKKTSPPKKQKVTLSEAGKKEFQIALHNVWQQIAGDLIQCYAESDEISVNRVSIPRAEVIESCLDADRLTDMNRNLSKEVKDFYHSDNYDEMVKIAEETFKFKFYGL